MLPKILVISCDDAWYLLLAYQFDVSGCPLFQPAPYPAHPSSHDHAHPSGCRTALCATNHILVSLCRQLSSQTVHTNYEPCHSCTNRPRSPQRDSGVLVEAGCVVNTNLFAYLSSLDLYRFLGHIRFRCAS